MSDDSLAVLLALSAAISWGFSAVYVRLALQHMPTSMGTLVSLVTGIAFNGALVLAFQLDDLTHLSASDALVFAAIGVFNFPFGRYMNYLSIRHLGITRSTPILASVPVFSIAFSIVFLGETLSLATFAGTTLVLGGLYVTLTAPSQPVATPQGLAMSERLRPRSRRPEQSRRWVMSSR